MQGAVGVAKEIAGTTCQNDKSGESYGHFTEFRNQNRVFNSSRHQGWSRFITVANLDNQIAFYQQALGFQLHWREGDQAVLGTGERELLRLMGESTYKRYQRVTGLYHFAVLFPNRRELARVMARLFVLKYPNYPTDHIMTKTTYLDDIEGNGIELYCVSLLKIVLVDEEDGEYITTRADGSLSNGREPLDVDALFSHLEEKPDVNLPIPPETCIGHVHLHVRDLHKAVDFYHGVLGFDIMGVVDSARMAFVSAGGYHHHVGLNTWQGEDCTRRLMRLDCAISR